MTWLEFKYNDKPVCPHCRYEHEDEWEWVSHEDEGTARIDCDRCEAPIICMTHTRYTFSTEMDDTL